ncbi:MAG: MFS transporter [Gemmatimonadota bacterium]|nr:MAG: MFS transporter [Gemmatimonadota bacterium]
MRKKRNNVIALGWVSFLTDISSEMILPILPLFLANVLGTSKAFIGLIEGVAESSSSLLKIGSGWYSDRVRRRKSFALIGYCVSNMVKPLLALANTAGHVLIIRFVDRMGKGLRTAPRDALIAESSEQNSRGKAFGIHRMMDTVGAVVGASIAFLFLSIASDSYRTIFLLSGIPGSIAVLVLSLCVREKRKKEHDEGLHGSVHVQPHGAATQQFKLFLVCISIFTFSSVSYAFFILRANELGLAEKFIPLVYLLYTIMYALFAVPVGSLSDKMGRTAVLGTGMFLHGLFLLGFSLADHALHALILFAVYGIVVAITETIPRALVSDLVVADRRGTALGMYHTAVGIAPLPANLLFGFAWSRVGSQIAFSLWGVLSLTASFFFVINRRKFQE